MRMPTSSRPCSSFATSIPSSLGGPTPAWTRIGCRPMPPPALVVRTLADGGQKPMDIAALVAAFIDASHQTLELALYDVRLPSPTGDVVAGAIRTAATRGVAVRI